MQTPFEELWLHPVFRQRGKGKLADLPDRPLPSRESGLETGSGAGGTGDRYEEPVFSEGGFFPHQEERLDAEASMRLCLAQGSVRVC